MNRDLRCYLTYSGIEAENEARHLGRPINITHMVFGDGILPESGDPREQTSLIHLVQSVSNSSFRVPGNTSLLVFKADLPADVGGFHINEIGLITDDGTLYGYARSKGDYKPTPDEGATDSIRYSIDMLTTNADVVEITVDLSGVHTSFEDVADAIKSHEKKTHPHTYYERVDNAATNNHIDAESLSERHVKLPQLWRAFSNKVKSASLSIKGIVKLSNSYTGTSEQKAVTEKALTLGLAKNLDDFRLYEQFGHYDSNRIYKTGEVCYIYENGEMAFYQMYAGPNMTCKGKAPSDDRNRQLSWSDNRAPFWWIPYKANIVGMPFYWINNTPPEWGVMEINVDLPVAVYWRLARCYPHLVAGDVINTGDIRGEFMRVLDQGRGINLNQRLNEFSPESVGEHTHPIALGGKSGIGPYLYGTSWTGQYFESGAFGDSENKPRSVARPVAIAI